VSAAFSFVLLGAWIGGHPRLAASLLAPGVRFSYSCGMPHNTSQPDSGTPEEGQRAVPITSRFLFVDVAAQRAKQLRRGAIPRIDRHAVGHTPHKLERVAMEEVRIGAIEYTLPVRPDGSGEPPA
jgi:DNA-directed RNA polymerase subunit K/omega